MDRMEKYIREHRGDFDVPSLPSGAKGRFMSKVGARRKHRVLKFMTAGMSAVAAAVAAIVIIGSGAGESRNVERMLKRMAACESEIMTLVGNVSPWEADDVANTIRVITSDAIPLSSLLPDNLPSEERIRILEEYYNRKIEALEWVKSQYEIINEL